MLAALDSSTKYLPSSKMMTQEKIARATEWARAHGLLEGSQLPASVISDKEVDDLIAERNNAKKSRDFTRADAIRKQLTEAGIVVEDTKDGIRWKRK